MMLMLFTGFLFSVPLSCFAFIPDNTDKLTSLIGELTERLADLEERLSTQEYINIDLETRLKVQERKNREQEDLIKALSARTCITSKQADLERQQDEFLHHLRFNRKSSVDRKKTDSESSVATTFEKATVSKKDVNDQFKIRHGFQDANRSIKDVQNIDCGKDKLVTLACKRGGKLKCTVAFILNFCCCWVFCCFYFVLLRCRIALLFLGERGLE